jgi:transposase
MSDSLGRRWVRHFNEGHENVHYDPWSGRSSVVNEHLVRTVEEKIQDNRRFTISSLSQHLPQMSRSLLHEIVSDKLRFRKLCSRWMSKMLTDEHKMKQPTWHA